MILQISAGTGPVEVRRFVAMLAAHIGKSGWVGDPTAPRSVRLEVPAEVAERWTGTHALLAAFRGKGRRRRWFVEVRTFAGASGAFPPMDIVVRATRAGGPGGQNVNKRATAARAVDTVSGEAVRVVEQRSFTRNRALALERLEARLAGRRAEEEAKAEAERRRAHHGVQRGDARYTWRMEQGVLVEVNPPMAGAPTGTSGTASARSLHVHKANRSHDASASLPPPRV